MTRSAEEAFYLDRYHQGGMRFDGTFDREATWRLHFAPGKRYHLLYRRMRKPCGTVVEIGCAYASTLMLLKEDFGCARAVGLDLGIPPGQPPVRGVELMAANFNQALPLEDGSVDVFIAMMVIEHLFDPFHAFREIRRVLTPSGFAVINLPLVTSLKNRLRLAFGRLPVTSFAFDAWFEEQQWDGNHLHYFSLPAIRALARKCGLRVDEVAAVGRGHAIKALLPSMLASEITLALTRD